MTTYKNSKQKAHRHNVMLNYFNVGAINHLILTGIKRKLIMIFFLSGALWWIERYAVKCAAGSVQECYSSEFSMTELWDLNNCCKIKGENKKHSFRLCVIELWFPVIHLGNDFPSRGVIIHWMDSKFLLGTWNFICGFLKGFVKSMNEQNDFLLNQSRVANI